MGVAFEMSSSCAVTFSGSEYGLPRTCVGWLTMADVRCCDWWDRRKGEREK